MHNYIRRTYIYFLWDNHEKWEKKRKKKIYYKKMQTLD